MEPAQHLDLFKILLQAGIIVKAVLALLFIASILSWAIIIKKRKFFAQLDQNNQDFFKTYKSGSSLKDISQRSEALPFSPYKEMFVEGYTELIKTKNVFREDEMKNLRAHFREFGMELVGRGIRKGINTSNIEMDRLLSSLASVGSITPFIGLFGTVWGIIDSFTGLSSGGATLESVAPGIAEALVATAIGLLAAIPAVWFYNHFSNENVRINNEMENFELELLNAVERSVAQKE